MKYIKQYEFIINDDKLKEIKNLGISTLFHAIKSDRAIKALNENKLGGYSFQRIWKDGKILKDDDPNYEKSDYLRGISTSRDIEFCAKWNDIIFVFDREKIKNKYKILPYNWAYHIGNDYRQRSIKREREEFIITGFNKNIKRDPRNLKFMKMLETPNGYIEPLDKYLVGFFISGFVVEYMNEDIKKQLQSHPKYLGVYLEERTKTKNLSLKDKIITTFNKKFFEHFDEDPKVGEYVIIYGDDFQNNLKEFFANNIGQIIKYHDDPNIAFPYDIQFDKKLPDNDYTISVDRDEIIEHSFDEEALKINKDIKKYNL